MMTDDETLAYADAHAEIDRPPEWVLTVYWDTAEQRFRTKSIEFDHDFTPTAETEVRLAVSLLLDHLSLQFDQMKGEMLR